MFCDIQRIKFLGKAKICVDLKLIFSVFLLFFTLLFEDENQLKTFVSHHRKSCFSEHAQTFDRRVQLTAILKLVLRPYTVINLQVAPIATYYSTGSLSEKQTNPPIA